MIDSAAPAGTGASESQGDDPIVAAVRAERAAHAASLGGDLRRMVEEYRQIEARERAHGRTIVSPRVLPTSAA